MHCIERVVLYSTNSRTDYRGVVRMTTRLAACLISALSAATSFAQSSFVNFENLGIHPLDMTPDGKTLLVANTADGQLELISLESETPKWVGSIPVGVDPVSVRAR